VSFVLASESSVWRESSVVSTVYRSLKESSVVSTVYRSLKESRTARWIREGVRRARERPAAIGGWARNATVTSKLTGVSRAVEHSGVARASREGGEWATHSLLYRWLTAEPEPDVVVIDLRETLSVGPVIELLDRVLDLIVPYWAQSIPGRVLDVLVGWGERAAGTRVGRLLVAMLEPPDPPEQPETLGKSEADAREDEER
jgi:hypothetical protein